MTSRSDMIPTMRPSSTTGNAPIRFSPSLPTASLTRASALIVSTVAPLLPSTAAMLIVASMSRQPLPCYSESAPSKGRHAPPRPGPQSAA
jgi:hypothetical protein